MMKYLEFAEKFYILILTLRTSFGNVSRFLISIAPIFFAFVALGVILFSDYNDFVASIEISLTFLVCRFYRCNSDSVFASKRR